MDVCEVMVVAIEMEAESELFYQQAASTSSNPLAIRTFEALAEWEVEHRRLLEAVHAKAEATQSCPTLAELEAEELDMIEHAELIFKTALQDVDDTLAHDKTLSGANATEKEKERKAIAFYQEQLEATEDPNEKQLYAFLLKQERGHLSLLATTEEYLNDTKYWFFKEEMWFATPG